jgi:hypothetical protein
MPAGMESGTVATRLAGARTRALLGGAIAVVGIGLSASPYVWLEAWQSYGFTLDYLGFHVWVAVPFLALSLLLALGRVSVPAAGIAAVVMVAATVPALEGSQSLHQHTVERSVLVPAFLLALVAGAWGIDAHRRRGRRPLPVTVPLIAAVVLLTGVSIAAGGCSISRASTARRRSS